MENQTFVSGIIKNYNSQKGFGFITTQEYRDVFFHQSILEKDFVPTEKQAVLLTVAPSSKKEGSFEATSLKPNPTPLPTEKKPAPPFYEGRVKFYDANKGFGIIVTKEKGEVFFHFSKLEKGYTPEENDCVLAQVIPSKKKIDSFDASFVKIDIFNTFCGVYNRVSIFEKLDAKEQEELLLMCQEKMTEKELFSIWYDGFDVTVDMNLIYSMFIEPYIYSRRNIFEKLDTERKDKLLIMCQERATEEQVFDFWWNNFDVKPKIEILYSKFLENNYPYNREDIFKKSTEAQQYGILQLCQERATKEQVFDIWWSNFDIKPRIETLYSKFLENNHPYNRKDIFEKLTEVQQYEILQLCQNEAKKEYIFSIWIENFDIKPDIDVLLPKFIESRYYRNKIFEKTTKIEQEKILKICQEKIAEDKIFILWWENYNVEPPINYIAQMFAVDNPLYKRREIFNKLSSEFQENILKICQENANGQELYSIILERYPINANIMVRSKLFIEVPHIRQRILNKLSKNEQENLLNICQEKATEEQIFNIWYDGFDINISEYDIKKAIIDTNNKDMRDKLETASIEQKAKIVASFADEPHYNILLWTLGIIEEFNFVEYALNYFRLNTNNKHFFTKKAKTFMKEELNTKMLKTLDSWKKIEENEDGTEVYEATWRTIWFGDKKIQVCIDSNEAILSNHYFWGYSEEVFNLLGEYIAGRRVEPLTIYYKDNQIKNIEGLEALEEVIYKAYIEKIVSERQSIETKKERDIKETEPKLPINLIVRNQCIQYLNLLQIPALKPTQVFEIRGDSIAKGIDISVLFSIELPHDEVAIVWESLELEKSKATHIFKCSKKIHEVIFENIQAQIGSVTHIRSKLRSSQSDDIKLQIELAYYGNIEHNNLDFEIWRKGLHQRLPTLHSPK